MSFCFLVLSASSCEPGRKALDRALAGRPLALHALHLRVGGEQDVHAIALAVSDALQIGIVRRRAGGFQGLAAVLVQRHLLGGVGHDDLDRAPEHGGNPDVGHVAVHIRVEGRLLRDEYRHPSAFHGVANDAGHHAAFADSGLVADDEPGAALHVGQRQRQGVDLLRRDIVGDFRYRVAKTISDERVDRADLILQPSQRLRDCGLHVDRHQRIE